MKILAVDPGGTTGLALGSFVGYEVNVDADELPTLEAIDEAVGYITRDYVDPVGLVVCESFIPRGGAITWQPEAVESIGALRYTCWKRDVPFELQSPANAKRFSTNDKLARLGWRHPTPGGHADDALRHLLLAAVRYNYVNPEELLA